MPSESARPRLPSLQKSVPRTCVGVTCRGQGWRDLISDSFSCIRLSLFYGLAAIQGYKCRETARRAATSAMPVQPFADAKFSSESVFPASLKIAQRIKRNNVNVSLCIVCLFVHVFVLTEVLQRCSDCIQ